MVYTPPKRKTRWFHALKDEMPSMSGKVIVITGTTSGTGFVAAKNLALKGAKVLLLNRESERSSKSLEDLKSAVPNGQFVPIVCDLMKFSSVREAAKKVKQETDVVDVICNNAGVMALTDQATEDGYDQQMQVNVLSHFLLVKELYPLLIQACEKNGQARVVNHSSIARIGKPLIQKYLGKNGGSLGGDSNSPRWVRYQQTKLAAGIFSYALQEQLEKIGEKRIKCLVAHPGVATTQLQVTTSKDGGFGGIVERVTNKYAQSSEDGTCGIFRAMCDPNLHSGEFLGPKHLLCFRQLAFAGPAVIIKPEKALTRKTSLDIFWNSCTKACGPFEFDLKISTQPANE